jgi:hypothetical protein
VTGQPDLVFQRITTIPLATYLSALENWQLTGQDLELRRPGSAVLAARRAGMQSTCGLQGTSHPLRAANGLKHLATASAASPHPWRSL